MAIMSTLVVSRPLLRETWPLTSRPPLSSSSYKAAEPHITAGRALPLPATNADVGMPPSSSATHAAAAASTAIFFGAQTPPPGDTRPPATNAIFFFGRHTPAGASTPPRTGHHQHASGIGNESLDCHFLPQPGSSDTKMLEQPRRYTSIVDTPLHTLVLGDTHKHKTEEETHRELLWHHTLCLFSCFNTSHRTEDYINA